MLSTWLIVLEWWDAFLSLVISKEKVTPAVYFHKDKIWERFVTELQRLGLCLNSAKKCKIGSILCKKWKPGRCLASIPKCDALTCFNIQTKTKIKTNRNKTKQQWLISQPPSQVRGGNRLSLTQNLHNKRLSVSHNCVLWGKGSIHECKT